MGRNRSVGKWNATEQDLSSIIPPLSQRGTSRTNASQRDAPHYLFEAGMRTQQIVCCHDVQPEKRCIAVPVSSLQPLEAPVSHAGFLSHGRHRGVSLPSITTPDNHPSSDLGNCESYFSGAAFTGELLNLTQERKHV